MRLAFIPRYLSNVPLHSGRQFQRTFFNEGAPKHRNNTIGIRKAETQPLPRRIRPIILVISIRLLPTLDENLWELPVQFLPRSKNNIQ